MGGRITVLDKYQAIRELDSAKFLLND